MKWFPLRLVAAAVVVASFGMATSAVASAGSAKTSIARSYQQELSSYNLAKQAIQRTFRTSVRSAHTTFEAALAAATTSAERSAARQQYETAIIEAAAVRSNALTALGNPPTKVRPTSALATLSDLVGP